MTAVPAAGYQFDKWSGDIGNNTATNTTIVVTMDEALDITADFTASGGLYTITVNTNSFQGGSATIETSFGTYVTNANQTSISIQCVAGTVVNITATAAQNYSFVGWKGGISGTQSNVSFVVDSSKTITADFTAPGGLYTITVSTNSFQSGSSTINEPFGIVTCNATQTAAGTIVNVTAVAAEGYRFDGWKGGITGSQKNMTFVANASSELIIADFVSVSPSFQWGWAVGGVAAFLLVVLLVVKFTYGRAKKPDNIPPVSPGDSNLPHADVPE